MGDSQDGFDEGWSDDGMEDYVSDDSEKNAERDVPRPDGPTRKAHESEDWFGEDNEIYMNTPVESPYEIPPNNLSRAVILGERKKIEVKADQTLHLPKQDEDFKLNMKMDRSDASDDRESIHSGDLGEKDNEDDDLGTGGLASLLKGLKANNQKVSRAINEIAEELPTEHAALHGNSQNPNKPLTPEAYKLKMKELEERNRKDHVLHQKIEIAGVDSADEQDDMMADILGGGKKKKKKDKKDKKNKEGKSDKRHRDGEAALAKKSPNEQGGLQKYLQSINEDDGVLFQDDLRRQREKAARQIERDLRNSDKR